jgi:hypothetical protein
MAAAAAHTTLEVGPLSVAGLQRLVDRMPAQVRAQLRWSPDSVVETFASFIDGPKDEAALRALVMELVRQLQQMAPTIDALASQPVLVRSELEAEWREDAALLRSHVDPGTGDAAEWTIRGWISLIDFSLTLMPNTVIKILPALAELDDASLALPGSPLRVQALIMAAIEAARRGGAREIITELIDRAFNEMHAILLQTRMAGVQLDPFRGETPEERAARARRYAAHLRSALSDDDARLLDTSRLRTLR